MAREKPKAPLNGSKRPSKRRASSRILMKLELFATLPDELVRYIFLTFHKQNIYKFDFTLRLVNIEFSKWARPLVYCYNPEMDRSIDAILKSCIFQKGEMSAEKLYFLNRAVWWNLQPVQVQRQHRIPEERRDQTNVIPVLRRVLRKRLAEKLTDKAREKAKQNAKYVRVVFSYLDRFRAWTSSITKTKKMPPTIASALD